MKLFKEKGKLISIIVLLLIFLPLAGLAIYGKLTEEDTTIGSENINKDFKFDGKLYFYNKDKLIGIYDCIYDNCDYAKNTIDDSKYNIDYYNKANTVDYRIINNRYVFITDVIEEEENNAILYDLKDNVVLGTYFGKKQYDIPLEDNYIFVKDENDLWGVISLKDEFNIVIKPSYKYIGAINNVDKVTNLIINDSLVAYKNNMWYILSGNGEELSKGITNNIISYSGSVIYTKDNDNYNVYDYDAKEILSLTTYKLVRFHDSILELVTVNNELIMYDTIGKKIIGEIIPLTTYIVDERKLYPPYEINIHDNKIDIKVYSDQEYGTNKVYNFEI